MLSSVIPDSIINIRYIIDKADMRAYIQDPVP